MTDKIRFAQHVIQEIEEHGMLYAWDNDLYYSTFDQNRYVSELGFYWPSNDSFWYVRFGDFWGVELFRGPGIRIKLTWAEKRKLRELHKKFKAEAKRKQAEIDLARAEYKKRMQDWP